MLVTVVILATLILILGVAINRTSTGTKSATDGCSFEGVTTLMADDRTGSCSEETACYGATLGVGAGGFGTV